MPVVAPENAILLGLTDDTSDGLSITSDGRLSGRIREPGQLLGDRTVTLEGGGLSATTTTDADGLFEFPTPAEGYFENVIAKFTDTTDTEVRSLSVSFAYDVTARRALVTPEERWSTLLDHAGGRCGRRVLDEPIHDAPDRPRPQWRRRLRRTGVVSGIMQHLRAAIQVLA
jgi:hypothetical protein